MNAAKVTKWELIKALTGPMDSNKLTINGITYHVDAIEREDGSGNRFNVRVRGGATLYIETCD